MKTLLVLLTLAVAVLASGCASKTTEAASTKVAISNPIGRSGSIELPKNVEAEDLHLEVNPTTGTFILKAKVLKTDASTVIDSAGAVQTNAVGKLTETISILAPLVAPKPAN